MKNWFRALTGSFGARNYYLNLSRSAEFAPFFVFVLLALAFSAAQGWSDATIQKMAFDKAMSSAQKFPLEIKVVNGLLVSPENRVKKKLGDLTVVIDPKSFVNDMPRLEQPCFLVGEDGWVYCRSNSEVAFGFDEVKKRSFKIPELLSKDTATRAVGALIAANFLVTIVFALGFILLAMPFLFVIFVLVLKKRPGTWLAARVMISTLIPFMTAAYAAKYLSEMCGLPLSTTTQLIFALTLFFCLFLLYSTRGLALAILGELQASHPILTEQGAREQQSETTA